MHAENVEHKKQAHENNSLGKLTFSSNKSCVWFPVHYVYSDGFSLRSEKNAHMCACIRIARLYTQNCICVVKFIPIPIIRRHCRMLHDFPNENALRN